MKTPNEIATEIFGQLICAHYERTTATKIIADAIQVERDEIERLKEELDASDYGETAQILMKERDQILDKAENLVGWLEGIYKETEKGDGTPTECSIAYMADDAIKEYRGES